MAQSVYLLNRRTFLVGIGALATAAFAAPTIAQATPTAADKLAEADAVRSRIEDLNEELKIAEENYHAALDSKDKADAAVEEAQKKIDDATKRIDDLQEKLSKRVRSMYRSGKSTAIDLILGAATFDEFATNWGVLEDINDDAAAMVQETKDLRAQVEEEKVVLDEQKQLADKHAQEAEEIKNQAENSIASLEELLSQLDAESQALLAQEQEQAISSNGAAYAANSRRVYSYTTTKASYAVPSQGTVVEYALSRIGCPYVWGAAGPDAFDCSGLVRWAYLQVGISVPHQSQALFHAAAARLPVSEARPGDVLWISYGDGYNGHVGIACSEGGTHYVHAPMRGAFVRDTDPLSWAHFTHCLRFT